ncbi:hypothetical protein EON83_24305 [bacterium]|nr:MAG: hypothetical protein EON83_24305 [bacterium]
MNTYTKLTRRTLLAATATAGAAVAASRVGLAAPDTTKAPTLAANGESWSFVLLGDLHFDRLAHHDREWVAREKPNDWRQIENYSRITAEVHPLLLAEVKKTVEERAKTAAPVRFVLQVGDIVEGLCGTPELANLQAREAIQWIQEANLGAPFLFCKGNHDVTGPGSVEAYQQVFLPFLGEQLRRLAPQSATPAQAFFAMESGDSLFAFFDAYDTASLEWLETTLAQSKARRKFVLIHPPVVPYGARSTWHIYSRAREAEQRARLLKVLGAHKALVLGGHIHRHNVISRRTGQNEDGFVQLALSSILDKPNEKPRTQLEGVEAYTPDQISVEPNFSPDTEAERRASLAAEAPSITHFEYADAPGYAVITIGRESVKAQLFSGIGQNEWKTRDLIALSTKA